MTSSIASKRTSQDDSNSSTVGTTSAPSDAPPSSKPRTPVSSATSVSELSEEPADESESSQSDDDDDGSESSQSEHADLAQTALQQQQHQAPQAQARPARPLRRRYEPYSVLGLSFEEVSALPAFQRAARINLAWGSLTCKIDNQLFWLEDDNPANIYHLRICEIGMANEILEDERMRAKLDACLSNYYLGTTLNAQTFLGLSSNTPSVAEIRAAKKARREEWAPYDKLGALVIDYINLARRFMLDEVERDQGPAAYYPSPQSSVVTSVE